MPKPRHLARITSATAARDRREIWHRCTARHCADHRTPARTAAQRVHAQVDQVLADNGGRVPAGAR